MTRPTQKQVDASSCVDLTTLSKTGLFDLPIELSISIYELLLIASNPIHVDLLEGGRQTDKTFKFSQGDVTLRLSPALLQTCKTTHREAGRTMLERNTFAITTRDHRET